MAEFNVTVAVDSRACDEATIDTVMAALAAYHPALRWSSRGQLGATITVPAQNVTQATTTGVALVERATGHTALAAETMLTSDYDTEPITERITA